MTLRDCLAAGRRVVTGRVASAAAALPRRRAPATVCWLLLLALLPGTVLAVEDIGDWPPAVKSLLKRFKIDPTSLGVIVQEVGSDKPLLARNADKAFNPASVMKVVTTAVALNELGPDYTWRTEVLVNGSVTHGRLLGDLIVRGAGDPFLTTDSFWRLLREIRLRGIEEIAGDVILDTGRFQIEADNPGDFDGKPYRSYNALPHALLLNFATTRFLFRPDPEAGRVVIVADPPASTLEIDNKIKLTKGRCKGANYRLKMRVERHSSGSKVSFSGKYPLSCGEFEMGRAVLDNLPMVSGAFESMWQALGGRIGGKVRVGGTPPSAKRLYRLESRTLGEQIRSMNKWSNNVMTRMLLLTLGAERSGEPGTEAKGEAAIKAWMKRHRIDPDGFAMDNGAGLSRNASITPAALADLLLAVWRSPLMPEFIASLPIAGVDGTMRKRLRGGPLAGRMHIKTGLIDNVRAMAGFVLSRSGKLHVVVALHNYPNIHGGRGTDIQDALLRWVASR